MQYRTFYNDFILERTTESGNQTKTLINPIPDLQGTDDVENGMCLKQFVIGNYQLPKLSAEELSQLLNQSTPSETKQNLIVREYLMWIGDLMTRSKARNARPTPGRKKKKLIRQEATNVVNREEINNQGNNRKFLVARTRPTKREVKIKERQKQRKKLQTMMKKNPTKGAQSVLNEDYGEEQKLFPHVFSLPKSWSSIGGRFFPATQSGMTDPLHQ